MISVEAIACIKKYFVEASIARGWDLLAIRGRIASVLSSSAAHISTRWVDSRKTSVVAVRVVKIIGWERGMW